VALPTLPHPQVLVTLGVDTHPDSPGAAALDQAGRPLGTRTISTTPGGDAALLGWATTLGTVDRVGGEGTGSDGAGLARWLRAHGQLVVGLDRPDRAARGRQGKADDLDAHAAARAVQAGTATGQPKAGDATVEVIWSLRLARRSAVQGPNPGRQPAQRAAGDRPRWPPSPASWPAAGRAGQDRGTAPSRHQPRRPRPPRPRSRCGRSPGAGCS
jgi:Transposase